MTTLRVPGVDTPNSDYTPLVLEALDNKAIVEHDPADPSFLIVTFAKAADAAPLRKLMAALSGKDEPADDLGTAD